MRILKLYVPLHLSFPHVFIGNDITKYFRIIVQNLDRIIGYEFPDRNYLERGQLTYTLSPCYPAFHL